MILKCLRKDPAKRFQSVDQLCATLEKERTTKTDAPGWVSLELRVPHLPVHCVVDYSRQKARQVAPHLVVFAVQVRQTGLEASRLVSHRVQKACSFIRALDLGSNLRSAKITRTGPLAATLGLVLLGTVFAFGLGSRGKNETKETAVEASATVRSTPQANPESAPSLVATDASSAVITNEVDLGPSPDPASGHGTSVAPSKDFSLRQTPPAPTAQTLKAHTGAPIATGSAARMKPSQDRIQPSASAALRAPQNAISVSSATPTMNTMIGPQLPAAKPDSSEPTPTASPELAIAHADVTQQKPVETKPAASEFYLEIGSFKDSIWADKAVEQLSKLGFHALTIHKTHLWMQSYHVQVGPYPSNADVEAAERALASQDFKSHLVK